MRKHNISVALAIFFINPCIAMQEAEQRTVRVHFYSRDHKHELDVPVYHDLETYRKEVSGSVRRFIESTVPFIVVLLRTGTRITLPLPDETDVHYEALKETRIILNQNLPPNRTRIDFEQYSEADINFYRKRPNCALVFCAPEGLVYRMIVQIQIKTPGLTTKFDTLLLLPGNFDHLEAMLIQIYDLCLKLDAMDDPEEINTAMLVFLRRHAIWFSGLEFSYCHPTGEKMTARLPLEQFPAVFGGPRGA